MKKFGIVFLVILVILLVYFNIWVYRVYNRPPIIANEQVDRQEVIDSSQNSVPTEKFDEDYEYERNYKEYSFEEENIEDTEESIEKVLKQIDPDYNSSYYEIENTSSGITKVNSDGTYETVDMPQYINYNLKIGDFKFEAGFVVKVHNGRVLMIRDNNVDKDGMTLLLANKDFFKISKSEIDSYIERAEKEFQERVSNRKIIDHTYICTYDLKSKKKSIYVELETERYDTDPVELVNMASYRYEID